MCLWVKNFIHVIQVESNSHNTVKDIHALLDHNAYCAVAISILGAANSSLSNHLSEIQNLVEVVPKRAVIIIQDNEFLPDPQSLTELRDTNVFIVKRLFSHIFHIRRLCGYCKSTEDVWTLKKGTLRGISSLSTLVCVSKINCVVNWLCKHTWHSQHI